MRKRYILNSLALSAGLLLTATGGMQATNGTHLTSHGARAAGMAGATLAVGDSVMDLQANPAHLANRKKGLFEIGGMIIRPKMVMEDSLYDYSGRENDLSYDNKVRSEPAVFPVPYIGYSAPLGKNMGWGIAFYGQAGAGAQFNGIKRPLAFPGQRPTTMNNFLGADLGAAGAGKHITENTFSELSIARLTPGIAIKLGKLSVGVGLDYSLAMMEWRFTMSDLLGAMELPGAGFRYKSDVATATGGKIGLTFEVSKSFTVAYAYQSKSRYHLNGEMSVNAGAPYINVVLNPSQSFNLPNIKNYKTKFVLEEPEEHTVGFAFKTGKLTIGIDLGYIKWSNSYRTLDFRFEAPVFTTPMGNTIDAMSFNMNWEDSRVYAIGFEYKPGKTAFRFGYNYANSPVNENSINPLFPAIAEHHINAGIGFDFGKMGLDLAIEYSPPTRVESSMTNDWAMFHAFYGLPPSGANALDYIKNPFYKQAITSTQLNFAFGLKWKL